LTIAPAVFSPQVTYAFVFERLDDLLCKLEEE
jgi:hypothetical protein